MSRQQDIFDYNVQYTNDIVFTEMRTIGYYILHMINNNFKMVKDLYERNSTIDFKASSPVFQNAGLFYNAIQPSRAISIYTDQEFSNLCLFFKNSLAMNRSFNALANRFPDPIKCFIYFTKYFYIPVRLDVASVPEQKQKDFAKWWISTVSLLLYVHNYTIKFGTIIPTLDTYYQCLETISSRPEVLDKFKTITLEKIQSYLTHKYDPSSKGGIFYITMMKLIYNICIEIIRKFCPNYEDTKMINPNYDGAWLSPLDTDVLSQIKQIQSCINAIN